MDEPLLVVVTGPPASGKSSLARDLAAELRIPFLSKDEFKERLYEEIGSGEEMEERVERAALAILYSVAASNLNVGVSVLVESNFDANSDLRPLRGLDARIVQIHCGGDAGELAAQFRDRAASGKRHPGHDDEPEDADEVRRKIEAGLWDPLDLPGELIRVDDHAAARELAAGDVFIFARRGTSTS
ncbi:MAG TPA: AAA family ATPase [Gaiellaceae bacterium]